MPANPQAVARTREKIHEAAVALFTTKGFHGSGMREIAAKAGVSLGNLYNHHKTKQDLIAALLEEYEAEYVGPDTPLAVALAEFEDLSDLEKLGEASRQMVARYADYIRLIYVDVVELEGEHVKRLFAGMRRRYEDVLGPKLERLRAEGKLGDPDPIGGLMTATIAYFYLFNIEQIFGVRRLYGTSAKQAIGGIAKLLREGMLPR